MHIPSSYHDAVNLTQYPVLIDGGHIVALLMEAKRKSPRFLSPISITVQNILNVGHGSGIWAKEIADMFPSGKQRPWLFVGWDIF